MSFQFNPFKTSQVTVTGVATLVSSANNARSGISLTNLGSTDVYYGENNTVTTSTGDLLAGTKGTVKGFSTTGAVYAITSGASQAISVLETL